MPKTQQLCWFAKRCALAVVIAALCLLVFGVVGQECLFRRITGLPCATCGMSRAWICALRLDFAQAFFWHPLFWAVPLLALLLIFFGARRRWVLWTLIASAILFLAVYLIRMALLFPSSPPMTVEPDGLIPRLFGWRF